MSMAHSGAARWMAVLALAAAGACIGSASRAQSPPPAGFNWQALGEQTYNNNCSGCHQRSGRGISGGFPPLAGHAPQVAQTGGRAYIVRLVLFGLAGPIEVE